MKKPVRKINVAAPVKAASAKTTPKAITVGKSHTAKLSKAALGNAIVAEAAKPVQVPARQPKVARIQHDVVSLYTGASVGLNKRKSVTVLDLSIAGTKPDYILKDRSELIAETVKREYGNKPFPRGNIDAGVLKHLLWKGYLRVVSGDGGESTVLAFTKEGLAHNYAGSRKV